MTKQIASSSKEALDTEDVAVAIDAAHLAGGAGIMPFIAISGS